MLPFGRSNYSVFFLSNATTEIFTHVATVKSTKFASFVTTVELPNESSVARPYLPTFKKSLDYSNFHSNHISKLLTDYSTFFFSDFSANIGTVDLPFSTALIASVSSINFMS
jgi:hypothetical protein